MTDAPLDASPDKRNGNPFTFDPDDPLRESGRSNMSTRTREGEVAKAVRAMAVGVRL